MAARIERAIMKGTVLDLVQTRTMFTALLADGVDVTDAPAWPVYVHGIFTPILTAISSAWTTSTLELQYRSGSSWVTYDEVAFTLGASNSGDVSPNYVAVVLIGKALGLRKMGRKFFTGIPKSLLSGNALGGAFLAGFASSLLAYISPQTGVGMSDLTPGIVDVAGTFHPFVGGFVSSFLGTMRRRKPGLGI